MCTKYVYYAICKVHIGMNEWMILRQFAIKYHLRLQEVYVSF